MCVCARVRTRRCKQNIRALRSAAHIKTAAGSQTLSDHHVGLFQSSGQTDRQPLAAALFESLEKGERKKISKDVQEARRSVENTSNKEL